MAPKAGHGCKLYRNTGTIATPVWTEVADVADVSLSGLQKGLAELKCRSSNWTKNLPTIFQSFTIPFTLPHGLTAAEFTTLRTNLLAGTVEEWLIADGAIATIGNQGLRCPMILSGDDWDQALENVSSHSFTLTVAYMVSELDAVVDPSWLLTAGG